MNTFIKVLLSSNSGIPWIVLVILVLLCIAVYYVQATKPSKSKQESDMLASFLERQTQLDTSQRMLIEELRKDNHEMREEIAEIKNDLLEERENSLDLREQIHSLSIENKKLKSLVQELQTLVEQLTHENTLLKEQNKK